jgi:tRNA pseudouridine55 synthase
MECTVSSGTYIRSLARDIAQALGTCGHLSRLRRTRIGDFSLPEHATVPEVPGTIFREMDDFDALSFFGTVSLSTEAAGRFFHGAFIRLADIKATGMQRVTCEGKFIGLGMMDGDLLKPRKSYPN